MNCTQCGKEFAEHEPIVSMPTTDKKKQNRCVACAKKDTPYPDIDRMIKREATGYGDPIQQTIFMDGYRKGQADAAASCKAQVLRQYVEGLKTARRVIAGLELTPTFQPGEHKDGEKVGWENALKAALVAISDEVENLL